MKTQLLFPMAFYVIYICGLVIRNLICRLKAFKAGDLDVNYYKTYSDKSGVRDDLIIGERHVDNQFQLPTIFLVTCLTYIVVGPVDAFTIAAAWLFVFSRLCHSYVHLTKNKVLLRARIYGLGWVVITAMWVRILIKSAF